MAKPSPRERASSAARGSSSVVKQLQMLREFCPGWSESDLSSCLRQATYNVELAAERLMTGEYKPAGAPKPAKKTKPTKATTALASASTSATKKRPGPKRPATDPSSITGPPPQKRQAASHVVPPTPSENNTNNHTHIKTATVTPKASSIPAATPSVPSQKQQKPLPRNALLLCERWLVGICTTRKGNVAHREPLELSHYHTGNNTNVRFRGSSVEGNLAKSLSAMLTPILRVNPDRRGRELIELRAEALMEDTGIPTGGEVPLKLTVYISNPQAFFAIFDQSQTQAASKSSSSMFFGKSDKKANTRNKMTLTEAAFAFLQWAQYGNLPEIPDFSAKTTGESDDEKEEEKKEDSSEAADDTIMNEEDFKPEDAEEKQQTPEWAQSVNEGTNRTSLPEMADPEGFQDSIALRPYQRQALYWMMKREREGESRQELEKELSLLSELASKQNRHLSVTPAGISNGNRKDIHCECGPVQLSEAAKKSAKTFHGETNPLTHPLWQERFLATSDMDGAILFYVNELLGMATLRTPEPPKQAAGGILADDMGLGKTVMLLALILKSKENPAKSSGDLENVKSGPTLVVAPLSLISQWEEEIETKTSLSYRLYYGDTKSEMTEEDFKTDIIITTYGTMQSEFQKQMRRTEKNAASNGILGRTYLRIILDEAHCVKNQNTLSSKACCQVDATFRWVVTGTIIHNSLDDVFGLMKFLRHQPWCEPAFWKSAITLEMHRKEDKEQMEDTHDDDPGPTGMMIALGRVRRLLAPLMIRRTKASLNKDGTPILTLPPVESKTIIVTLTPAEREFYDALQLRSEHVFEGFIKSGTASKSWFAIFSMLSRLRMACDHIALTLKSHIDEVDWNMTAAKTGSVDFGAEAAAGRSARSNDGVDEDFLNGLLRKFRERSGKSPKKNEDLSNVTIYSAQVAETLSQAIKQHETHIAEECPICLENPAIHDAVITNCAHIFCRSCLLGFLKENAPAQQLEKRNAIAGLQCPNGQCPVCQTEVEASKIIALSKSEDGKTTTSFLTDTNKHSVTARLMAKNRTTTVKESNARRVLESAVNGEDSSKLSAVVQELHNVWQLDPGSKILVFSQFLGFLDLLETALRENEIPFDRLDGKLSLQQRITALEKFRGSSTSQASGPGPLNTKQRIGSVMLASMKSVGVGLNLVAASSVFICDRWWNSSVEDQCVNRIHRIGQMARVVRVRKFVIADSVEERIVELQKRKKNMASHVYSNIGKDGTMNDSRPSIDDLKLIFCKP